MDTNLSIEIKLHRIEDISPKMSNWLDSHPNDPFDFIEQLTNMKNNDPKSVGQQMPKIVTTLIEST